MYVERRTQPLGLSLIMELPSKTTKMLSTQQHDAIPSYSSESTEPVRQTYPNYRNFSNCSLDEARRLLKSRAAPVKSTRKGTFPTILFNLLKYAEEHGLSDIVEWRPHGRAFQVKNKKTFCTCLLPMFFRRQNSYPSFQRQLNVWGFLRLTKHGGYYHELFLKDRQDLLVLIPRQRYTTGGVRQPLDASSEPDLQTISLVSCCTTSNAFPTVSTRSSAVADRVPFTLSPFSFEQATEKTGPDNHRAKTIALPPLKETQTLVDPAWNGNQAELALLASVVPGLTKHFDASQSSRGDMDFFEHAVHE